MKDRAPSQLNIKLHLGSGAFPSLTLSNKDSGKGEVRRSHRLLQVSVFQPSADTDFKVLWKFVFLALELRWLYLRCERLQNTGRCRS